MSECALSRCGPSPTPPASWSSPWWSPPPTSVSRGREGGQPAVETQAWLYSLPTSLCVSGGYFGEDVWGWGGQTEVWKFPSMFFFLTLYPSLSNQSQLSIESGERLWTNGREAVERRGERCLQRCLKIPPTENPSLDRKGQIWLSRLVRKIKTIRLQPTTKGLQSNGDIVRRSGTFIWSSL